MTTRSLWQHQQESWNKARAHYAKGFRSILIQGVTGTGKTRMVAYGINTAISRHAPGQDDIPESKRKYQTVWFIVPRKELLWQSSGELKGWKINHGMISAKSKENPAFNVHVCSRDTLIRRIRDGQIKKWPNLIIMDEAHIALDQQLEIKEAAPKDTIIIGVTATPERLDGRTLKGVITAPTEKQSKLPREGVYDVMVDGNQLQWFVEHKFLKRPWVLSVPTADRLEGLDQLKSNKAGDVSAKALAELYKARAKGKAVMYGNEIEHYQKFGKGRSFLIFCRSLEQCESVSAEFTDAGIPTEKIDGDMSDPIRKDKIIRVETGKLTGLATVDLCTYGLDVPKISCAIMLRPTESVALFFQMIGRILRWDGTHERGLILDHVGNCDDKKHGHPLAPRVWNFAGRERKEGIPKNALELIAAVDKCPICYDLIIDGVCRTCGAQKEVNRRHDLKQVDGWLVEIKEPTVLKDRPLENQRHYQSMLANNTDAFRAAWYPDGKIDKKAVANMLSAAYDLKWKQGVKQVYFRLVKSEDKTINVSLIAAIKEIKGYHQYWAIKFREDLERRGLNFNFDKDV